MVKEEVEREYFDWIYDLVCHGRFSRENTYEKLLKYLHKVEFTYVISKDSNRAEDGIDLRRRFAYVNDLDNDIIDYLDGPCSVLEMMVALSIRCEEIMDDPRVGDRTGQWFWRMVVNLGLGSMTDRLFSAKKVDETIVRFLERDYEPDGYGGLFHIKNCTEDLRNVEIWVQMLWFLDSMV